MRNPTYTINRPINGWRDVHGFSEEERSKLRPIAETIAMLDSNAFFGMITHDQFEVYEQYLPEAHAIYEANGGDTGWASEASFIKLSTEKD